MVFADLHVHTDCSDGQLPLSEVPVAAWRNGVQVVAVTDHDRIHPDLDARTSEVTPGTDRHDGERIAESAAVTLVRGIELRVETDVQRIDLLGYGVDRTDDLVSVVDDVQENRIERGRAMVDRVEDHVGIDLDLEPGEGFGRPHLARAVDDHDGTDLDYQETFDELIGDDRPCYVARDVPSFDRGVEVLHDASGFVSLAHPLRYDDPAAALDRCGDLDAVERYYPYDREVDPGPVGRAIRDHDLAVTGGSDAHDDRLGRAGLSASDYRRIERSIAQG